MKYIWDIGNLNLSNSNEIQDNNGKYYQNDYNNKDLLYLYDDNNLKNLMKVFLLLYILEMLLIKGY